MIKTITAIFLALLITACSSETKKETNTTLTSAKQEKIEPKEPITQKASVAEAEKSPVVKSDKKEESKEPIATIVTLDDKEIDVTETVGGLTFKGSEGKAVFIILFGYRCPPCLQEMPNLIALAKKKYPDLEIIALEIQGLTNEKLKEFKIKHGINYTVAVGTENHEFIRYIASRARWEGAIPFFLAFNKKGEVKVVHTGALNARQLENVYKELKK